MNNQNYLQNRKNNPDLLDLLIFILKYKWLLIVFMLFAGVATSLYLYISTGSLSQNYYFSQCSISASSSDNRIESDNSRAEKIKIILQSRDVNMLVAKENKLSMINQKIWDDKTNRWVTDRVYVGDEYGGKLLTSQPGGAAIPEGEATLYVNLQNNILTIGFSLNDRDKAIKILDRYLSYISDFYRIRDAETLKTQRSVYEKQLLVAKDSYQKAQLAEKIIEVTDKELRAKTDHYYGYNMMDPMYVIDVKPQEQIIRGAITKERSSTKRSVMLTVLLMMAALVIALFLAGAIEYLTIANKNNPEKFAVLRRNLGFKKRMGKKADPD